MKRKDRISKQGPLPAYVRRIVTQNEQLARIDGRSIRIDKEGVIYG